MHTQVYTVTPEEAALWLSTRNFDNRPISAQVVARYAQEMKAHRWKLTGEAIIFDENGRLMDGQHRLKACVQANMPFETVLVRGVKPTVFDVIDDGKNRTMADVLAIQHVPNAKDLSSGLSFVWQYANKVSFDARKNSGREIISTKQLLEKFLDRHKGLKDSTRLFGMLEKRPGKMMIPPSLAIGLHYLFSLIDKEKADSFMTSLQSGLDLKEGDPILALRARLITYSGDKTSSVLRRSSLYALTVVAWNAYAKGVKLKRIAWSPSQALPEIEDLPPDLMKGLL